jgi:hypothetical protein
MGTEVLEYTGEELLNALSLKRFDVFINPDVLSGYKEYTPPKANNFKKAFLGGIILVTLTAQEFTAPCFYKSTSDITQIVEIVNRVKNKFETDLILKSIIANEGFLLESFEDFSHKLLPIREFAVNANIVSISRGKPDPIDPENLI